MLLCNYLFVLAQTDMSWPGWWVSGVSKRACVGICCQDFIWKISVGGKLDAHARPPTSALRVPLGTLCMVCTKWEWSLQPQTHFTYHILISDISNVVKLLPIPALSAS